MGTDGQWSDMDANETPSSGSAAEVFRAFLRLGFTSFGGPVAHIGFFRTEFVERRRWLREGNYADIVALCQFLPGPASSQVGVSLGMLRAGLPGALAAWCGFTLPSAVALILFAYGMGKFADLGHSAWLGGLKAVAVAVVAQAVWAMSLKLCPDRQRKTVAVVSAILALAVPSSLGQVVVIALGAIYGWFFVKGAEQSDQASVGVRLSRKIAIVSLCAFAALLATLPWLAVHSGSHAIDLFARFYRSGALVFGGGHVVLPLLQDSVVPPGWIGNDAFLAVTGGSGSAGSAFHILRILGSGNGAATGRLARAASSASSPFTCRRSSCSSGSCRSGMACAKYGVFRPHWAGSTPPSSACFLRRSTRRSGPAACDRQRISGWRQRLSCC